MQRPTSGVEGDFAQLRQHFDRDDPEMVFGLNIKTPRIMAEKSHAPRAINSGRGLHNRWHVKKKIVKPDCELCNPTLRDASSKIEELPSWLFNDKELQDILLERFPRMGSHQEGLAHLEQAKKWVVAIVAFYRMEWSIKHIAYEYEIFSKDENAVRSVLGRIQRVIQGVRLDGKPHTGKRRGRPRRLSLIENKELRSTT